MSRGRWRVCLLLLLLVGPRARAEGPELDGAPAARFAILVGVNQSVDADTPPLRYADDDAAGYLDLFRTLGARTYLLSRFDENTRRLRPQAVAESQDPKRAELLAVLDQVAADIARARARQVRTILYFVYAGHGNVQDGRGYLALEDSRLYGSDIETLVLDRTRASETHLIVDACYSVFLAFSRGPGGERREAHGFSSLGGLAARPDVGLLLSTSSARESHEWMQYQAGIFSHEVRSGLLGAADADRDGQVTYREIAAFVDRANASVANEKFRPDVYVKPPGGPSSTGAILDLRAGLGRRLELSGEHPGHYLLEDARGVRLADFHNAPGQPLHLIRLANLGRLFLRRVGAADEYVLETAPAVLRFEDLRAQPSTTQTRGAAQESFTMLFSLPFSQQVVDGFVLRDPLVVDRPPGPGVRRAIGLGLLGVGAAAGAGALWALLSARGAQQAAAASQAEIARANDVIEGRNHLARWLVGAGGAAVAAGAVLLLLPRSISSGPNSLSFGLTPDGRGIAVYRPF